MKKNRLSTPMAILLVILALLAISRQPGAAQAPASLEPELVSRLQAEGSANYFVKMEAEADLSPAESMDWDARGEFVWNTLNEVARTAQAPVLDYCQKNGLDCTSMIVTNSVFVRAGNLTTAQALATLPGVAYLRLERILPLPDTVATDAAATSLPGQGEAPEATMAWGIADTKANQVWALGYKGAGIKVANIDSGVQWNHPALDQAFACPGQPANAACWRDPSNICGAGGACDNNGHGTHTMGTMVADDDPALTYTAGMAPDATWIACKGCETDSCSEFALNACADWILAPVDNPANRPNIVNNSWGGDAGGDNWYQVKVVAWRAAGIFPAFAAGNNGPLCTTLRSPGDYQESMASAAHDSGRTIASFSSRGPSAYGHDPYTKPNISAPGVNICSSVPTNGWDCTADGTSMASPHTAGAVALIWQACPALKGNINGTSELLQNNADTPPAGICGAPPDGQGNYTYGYGYLNVLRAVQACSGPTVTSITPDHGETGSSVSITNLAGTNFQAGAEVKLTRSGKPDINASGENVVSATKITCQVNLAGAAIGSWNVVVTNPDAKSGSLANGFTVTGGTPTYLPLVVLKFPPIPDPPVLNTISNPDGDGNYTVSWSTSAGATGYTLQEDDNASFSSPATAYSGPATSKAFTGKPAGKYYYRVNASNAHGTSDWSNTRSVTVSPPAQPIVNGDFEAGATGWTEYSSHGWPVIVNETYLPPTVYAHSGSWAVWLGGEYDDVSYIQQQVTVPPSLPYLSYWHWLASEDTCGYDFAIVKINATVVQQYDLCVSKNTGGWVENKVNLSPYAGQSVTLQIRVQTDGSLNSNMFVDDVSFKASALVQPGSPGALDGRQAAPRSAMSTPGP